MYRVTYCVGETVLYVPTVVVDPTVGSGVEGDTVGSAVDGDSLGDGVGFEVVCKHRQEVR